MVIIPWNTSFKSHTNLQCQLHHWGFHGYVLFIISFQITSTLLKLCLLVPSQTRTNSTITAEIPKLAIDELSQKIT
jgi:hypothetical protein